MSEVHEGGCLCGAIRYRVRGVPSEAFVCHCTFCQRRSGSAFAIEVFFPNEQVEFLGDKPSTYTHHSDASGRWLEVEFCARCGTAVGLRAERRSGQRAIMGGTFDDPQWFKIRRHTWTKSKQCWVEIPHDVLTS